MLPSPTYLASNLHPFGGGLHNYRISLLSCLYCFTFGSTLIVSFAGPPSALFPRNMRPDSQGELLLPVTSCSEFTIEEDIDIQKYLDMHLKLSGNPLRCG